MRLFVNVKVPPDQCMLKGLRLWCSTRSMGETRQELVHSTTFELIVTCVDKENQKTCHH